MMHNRKNDILTNLYFRQMLCSIALPILLCIFYAILIYAHNENQVEEALWIEIDATITRVEQSHHKREEQANRYFLQSNTLRSALLDANENTERAKALWYASLSMQDAPITDLNGSNGVVYVSLDNNVCIGTDIVQGDLSRLWRIYYTSQPTFEAWKNKYLKKQPGNFYYTDSYNRDAQTGNYASKRITRVSYYIGRNQNSYWILMWWGTDTFAEELNLAAYDKQSYAIYNAFNEVVFEQNHGVEALNMYNETREGVWTGKLQGKKVFLVRRVSENTGMSYCYAVDYGEAMADFNNSLCFMLGMLVLCLFSSTFISMKIARRNAMPIREISTVLQVEPETVIENNFHQLSYMVKKVVSEKKTIGIEAVRNKRHMEQAILKKIILEGESANDGDAEELGLLQWHGFCVMMLHISVPISEEMNCEEENIQASFIKIIQSVTPDKTLIWQDKIYIGVLLPVTTHTTDEENLRTGERIVKELMQLSYVKVRIGIGRMVASYRQIAQSYHFAKAALGEAAHLDLQICASNTVQVTNDTLYSETRERQLKNHLKMGNAKESEILLTELYIQSKNSAPATLQMFLWNLLLTMQRLANGYNDTELMKTVDEVVYQMEQCCISREFDTVFKNIVLLSNSICQYMQRQEKSRGAAFEEFIHAHYAEADFGMQHMLDRFNMSQTSFQLEFKRSLGITFGKYLENLRMKYAAEMLCQGHLNIANIALRCGYLSDVSFRRVFKKYYGVSPTEYKKNPNE